MLIYVIAFLAILSVLVFVHEFGHYWVARRCGVRVEVFSVGFGRELAGFTDRAGTRWKLSVVPLGGYVKFFGDANAASAPDSQAAAEMSPADRAVAFPFQPLWQRALVVAAGPVANFLFAIVLLAGLFMLQGQPYTPPVVDEIRPDTPAAASPLQPGDRIVAINGESVKRFEDLQQRVRLNRATPLTLTVIRDGNRAQLQLTPELRTVTDRFGNTHRIGMLGVVAKGREVQRLGPVGAVGAAAGQTYDLTQATLVAVSQIVTGKRNADDIGGPVRIAQMSGQVAQMGIASVLTFMALLSINLGLINLFPVPMLDGGHLLFYGIEAVRGRPLGERAQEYGFRIGFALVITLMLFATWNDLAHLQVFDFLRSG